MIWKPRNPREAAQEHPTSVPMSLVTSLGCSGLATLEGAGPAPKGNPTAPVSGSDPKGTLLAVHRLPTFKSETPPRSSQTQEDSELSCYSQRALPGFEVLN